MHASECYALIMGSTDGFIQEMEQLGNQRYPEMTREHAKFLIGTLYGAILSLSDGNATLVSISLACQLFEDFHSAPVRGHASLGQRGAYCGDRFDEYLARKQAEFGEDVVLEATALNDEKCHAYSWMLVLRKAFVDVAQQPNDKRTIDNVRTAFQSAVEQWNEGLANEFPNEPPLDFRELKDTYLRLTA